MALPAAAVAAAPSTSIGVSFAASFEGVAGAAVGVGLRIHINLFEITQITIIRKERCMTND